MTNPDITAPGAGPSLGELALEDRAALRRVAGLSTELADVSERPHTIRRWVGSSFERSSARSTPMSMMTNKNRVITAPA